MDLALINVVPFLMALFLATPFLNRLLTRQVRAWGVAAVMATLFVALLGYFPHVQQVDLDYKEQRGIPLTESYSDDAAESESSEGDTGETVVVADTGEGDTSQQPDDATDAAETADTDTEDALSVSNPAITRTIEWVPELGLTLSFYLDGISLLFSLIVTGVGAGIFLYAGYYFEDESEQTRFLIPFSAFAGAMLGLVLSGNLLTLFVMWELTSVTSFLLIAFKGNKYKAARFGGMQAFIITGIGALALIAGIVVLGAMSAQILDNGSTFVFDIATILNLDYTVVAEHPYYAAVVILLALGAFTKSAQFPFHFWLPGAMSAPTPASAYLHSATMVKAGVYLLLRMYPPLHYGMLWTQLLVTIGVMTMFVGAFIAIFQRDLKGLLAYSTISWLGALVAMIGLPDFLGIKAALLGIIAHALYKAALFLSAGTIDHNTGTRIIDELGGLRKHMPVITVVVVISALSMGGVPIFFGFVAKEVLLDAFVEASFPGVNIAYGFIIASAVLTVTAGLILIWDVFFKEPDHEIHYHASPIPMNIMPVLLATGTVVFSFLIDGPFPIVEDVLHMGVQKPFTLYLLPPDPFTNTLFLTSMAVLVGGVLVFLARSIWLPILQDLPLLKTTDVYRAIFGDATSDDVYGIIERIGDLTTRLQTGQIRYYLVVIFGTLSLVILSTGIIGDLAQGQEVFQEQILFDASVALKVILLVLGVLASFFTVLFRKHLHAALSLGILGYSVGGLFLLEPAPDVSLVQFLIETLGTVLIIVMIGRISEEQRYDVMGKLWAGNSEMGGFNVGILRDVAIAGAVGLAVFFFSLTALVNRPDRETIAQYHLENTYEQVGVQDVVGAIVADYRAMDTVVEIIVFSIAGLGVLTILTRGLEPINPFVPRRDQIVKKHHEFDQESLDEVEDTTNLNTHFTRMVARLVLPLSLLIALSHIIHGSSAPGDGFTAGAISGLVTALWFVVYGYRETRERLAGFAPYRLMRAGLVTVFINGLLPLVLGLGSGAFLAHVDYGKLLGIAGVLDQFGLKFTTAIVFEVGIALTVLGGIGMIMEAIAHPKESRDIDEMTAQEAVQDDHA